MITINCTFNGNPPPKNVTWERNGTVLDPNSFIYISINTESTYSKLSLIPQGLEDSGTYVCVTENIIGRDNSSEVNITVQSQLLKLLLIVISLSLFPVAPSPVSSLTHQPSDDPISSVKLTWSYGFNGNADIIGVNITYEAVSNKKTKGIDDPLSLAV